MKMLSDLQPVGYLYTAIAVSATFLIPGSSLAQQISSGPKQDDASIRAYWTPERLANATPMSEHPTNAQRNGLPVGTEPISPGTVGTIPGGSDSASAAFGDQAPPTNLEDWTQQIYTPKQLTESQAAGDVIPQSSSTYGYPYTETKVFPTANAWPYRATGKLYFTVTKSGGIDTPGNWLCSASVIAKRIVVTAGHCVGSPLVGVVGGAGFIYYSNWLFIPNFTNGTGSDGSWTWSSAVAGNGWVIGNGSFPNAEDWGFLVMNDLNGVTIATKVGHYGYSINALSGNNVTLLGYPGNLDGGLYMEQTQGQVNAYSSNTYIVGTASGPGASGGPWLLGFGKAPSCSGSGCPTGVNGLGINDVVGVDSYGPAGTIGFAGASEFNSDWLTELTTLCNAASGNC